MTAIKVGDKFAEEPSSDDYDNCGIHPECGDYRSYLLLCGAGESGEGPHWRAYQHHDSGIMGWKQLFAAGFYCTKYIHRVETR